VTSPRDVCLWAGFPTSRCMLQYTTHYPETKNTTLNQGSMVSIDSKNEPDSQYYSYSAYSATATGVATDTQNTSQVGEKASNRRLTNTSHISDAPYGKSNYSYSGRFEHSTNTRQTSVAVSSGVPMITWADLDIEDIALANEVLYLKFIFLRLYLNRLFACTMS